MIKRAYFLHTDSELSHRVKLLAKRQEKRKPLFKNAEEWESELDADWRSWWMDAYAFMRHVYPTENFSNRQFILRILNGNVVLEEADAFYANQPTQRTVE